MGSLGAYAAETIHVIDACCPLATGIGGTLIDVNVASLPCGGGAALLKFKPSRNRVRMRRHTGGHSSPRQAASAIGH